MQPYRLVLLEVDQQLGQPLRVGAERQSPDQRGAISFGSGEDVEQLLGTGVADSRDYARPDLVVVDRQRQVSQPIPLSLPSKPCGSGGNTVKLTCGATSAQLRSGGGGGMQKSG
jgi:hypothetical protein